MSTTLPADVPADRDAAERYLMADLASVADRLEALEEERTRLYERRKELYHLGRALVPPVPSARMARWARVSDAALTLSSARRTKEK